MNYAQEGLEANEVDNSLTITNAALSAELDAHSNTATLLAELEVQQKEATKTIIEQHKTIIEQQNNITKLQNKLAAERQELGTWLDPLAEMLAGRIVASAAFETAIDAVMENITDSSHFARIVDDMIEDRISNLDFEVRVR